MIAAKYLRALPANNRMQKMAADIPPVTALFALSDKSLLEKTTYVSPLPLIMVHKSKIVWTMIARGLSFRKAA